MRVVTNAQGQSYVEHEIIVWFAPTALRRAAIDDRSVQSGSLGQFLTPAALAAVGPALGCDASQVEVFKIYTNMTSADTLSVTRLGDTIRIDDFWASLLLQLPPGACEQATADRLVTRLFPLVRYAQLNGAIFIGEPGSAPAPQPAPQPTPASAAGLYPNPSPGEVTLAGIDDSAGAAPTVEIYGTAGTVLRRITFPETCTAGPRDLRLPVADLPAGQYYYRLTTGRGSSTGRFTKQ